MHTVRIGWLSFLLLLLPFIPAQLWAQDSVAQYKHRSTGYLASYWYNGLGLIASPAHWNYEDWSKAGSSIAITGILIAMDEPISTPFFKWQSNSGTTFGDIGYTIGSVPFQLGITGAALGVGALAHSDPMKHFALDNLQAQIFTGGITWLVKEISQRERPINGNGPYKWHGPLAGSGNASFFSGHSSIAFSTATMIFLHSKKQWWVGVLSYGVAAGVSVSRMQRQAHWASDVLLGAVLGSAVSTFVYKQQEKRRAARSNLKTLP